MKKYLLAVLLLATFQSFGQFLNYTNINGRYKWIAGKFDSTFTLPSGPTPSLRTGGGNAPGALFYSTTDSVVYEYTGSQWRPLHGSDTSKVQIAYVRNTSGSSMTTGQVVYINGSTGTTPTIALANNKNDSSSAVTFGIVRGNIANNAFGWITTFGPIEGINTNAYTEGEQIYLDSISGGFTHDKPVAPYHMVVVGYVIKKAANGILFVKIQNGYELEELHNVKITAPVLNKSVLVYDSIKALWVDSTVSAAGLGLGGSGTTNYVSKWTGSTALGNSQIFDNGTSVGIGTASPSYLLSVYGTSSSTTRIQVQGTTNAVSHQLDNNSGSVYLSIDNSSGSNFGGAAYTRYLMSSGSYPLVFGTASSGAMTIFSSGRIGMGTGTDAGYRLDVSGTFRSTLDANINGLTVGKGGGSATENTAIGYQAINATNTGSYATAVGYQALKDFTGNSSVAVGANALFKNTTGTNIAVGTSALYNVTTGAQNTAVGSGALQTLNAAINDNTAVGHWAARLTTTGNQNAALGSFSLSTNTTGKNATAIGYGALSTNTTGNSNTAVGFRSGQGLTTGAFNTFLGSIEINEVAGSGITTGSYNTIIGAQITGLSSSLSNTIILADGQGNQRLYINNSGNVGIGTTSPTTGKLQVLGGTYQGVFNSTTQAQIKIALSGTDGYDLVTTSTFFGIYNGFYGEYRLTLFNNGNLGIGVGVTDAGYKLDVNGTARVSGAMGVNVGPSSSTATLYVSAITYNKPAVLIKDNVGGFLNSLQIQNSSAGVLFDVDFNKGRTAIGTTYSTGQQLLVLNNTYNLPNIVLKPAAGGYTQAADMIQVQNSAGTIVGGISLDGFLYSGNTALETSSAISVASTTKGALFPRMTSTQRDAITSPATGLLVYQTTDNLFSVYNGTNWQNILAPNSSGNVGIGTTSPNASALLDVSSTTKGFLPPRMTGAEAEAIGTPAAGLLVYANNGNGTTITSTGWWGYDGTNWVKLN